jgi:hypothetical protein
VQPYMWIIVAVVVIVLVIALVVVTARRNRRRAALRERFGPEYDLAVKRGKDRRAVEQRLEALSQRRDALDIREVAPEEHSRFGQQWDEAQARFVDDPGQAVADADGLVNAVLRSRGYPVESFDDRAALVATDHQDVVEGYRSAHDVFADHLQGSTADTEQLRQAFLHYREVFGRLNMPQGGPAERGRHAVEAPPVEETRATDEAPPVEQEPAAVEAPTVEETSPAQEAPPVDEAPPPVQEAPVAREERRPPIMSPAVEPAAEPLPEPAPERASEPAAEPAAVRLDAANPDDLPREAAPRSSGPSSERT